MQRSRPWKSLYLVVTSVPVQPESRTQRGPHYWRPCCVGLLSAVLTRGSAASAATRASQPMARRSMEPGSGTVAAEGDQSAQMKE